MFIVLKQADFQLYNDNEQSGALTFNQLSSNDKLERGEPREEERDDEEEDDDEDSRSPIAALEDEEEDDDDAESVFDKSNIPPPSATFMNCCINANLTDDIAVASWDIYYHASQRAALEGSESAWQLSAIYYYLLSRGIKRRGKPARLLTQRMPVSILTIASTFDVSIAELMDKTVRFADIIHSRKMRRYLDYLRRIQEGLAVSCVIFKKFCKVYNGIFEQLKEGTDSCPSSHELFTVIWTSFLVMKSRLQTDDLVNNYQLLFCMIDQIYTKMSLMEEGIIHHLNQKFVGSLIDNDSTILRALCTQFGGCILDTRHFYDHTYKKMKKTGVPESWDFLEDRDMIINVPKLAYDQYVLQRGNIDERVFIPTHNRFPAIFKEDFISASVLKKSFSGRPFRDAEFLSTISSNQCLEKIAHGKTAAEKVSQSKERPKVPCAEYSLELGKYSDEDEAEEVHKRLVRIIGNWNLDTSKLQEACERMSDNPMATILLKCDELTSKFERTVGAEHGETNDSSMLSKFHKQLRNELEKSFLIFIEKIIVTEVKKKVREEDLLTVIRREEFLGAVFCFCIELVLCSNGYDREFPWSAKLCACHPFMFHKVIDLMISHEKRLSRQMIQHFSKIEESIITYYAWKFESPMWPMIVRCPFTNFSEFGEDWADKCKRSWEFRIYSKSIVSVNTYSPMKFSPTKKPDDEDMRDELGRPIVPQNQTSRTLRIFLKRVSCACRRTYFTAARRLQELTDRVSMGTRGKSQCWSLFDYLLRNDTLVFMDRHIDQIILCCVFVILRINESPITFTEILAQYRRQSTQAMQIYRHVPVFAQLLDGSNPSDLNTKETILERLEAPRKFTCKVDIIKFYNIEFRDRIKFIIGQIDSALDDDLMEMPVPTIHGLTPVRVYLTDKLSIQMLPKTQKKDSKQEMAINHLERTGRSLEAALGRITE
ncbi:CRE-LIN-35 protein [Caenorhabditis remanei]|uniref:CRE-LIN-35 protein n=1 Tax=Caenorhabditis remanei TaxID=31234 RepID=E3LY90_CAERE|nr:CRE-LIN-35 protein [Caenorhabditis remanei]